MKLSQTQKKVFCALNAYPEYNDRQIADLLHMRRSTVTIARHYLEKEKFYTLHLFPNFEKVPIALIGINYGDYERISSIDYKKRMELLPKESKIPEHVFSFSSEYKGITISFSEQLSTIKGPFEEWTVFFKNIDPSLIIKQHYFPREMIKVYKFMKSTELLHTLLEIPPFPKKKKNKKVRVLRKKEKQVLLAWMEYPSFTNEQLSEKIHLSRAAIGSIKKRLLEYELIQVIQTPYWHTLGLHLGILLHLQYLPKDLSLLSRFEELPETILLIGTSYELIAFSLFKDYDDYQRKILPIIKTFQKEKILIAEKEEILFPLSEAKYTLNAFDYLQKKFLGNGTKS